MALRLFIEARDCLYESNLNKKILQSEKIVHESKQGFELEKTKTIEPCSPGRPKLPKLVSPVNLPRRGFSNPIKHLAMIHAIAHIEFNAINLAWDAIYRFQDMPRDYYIDWLKIAGEETKHFCLLRKYLNERRVEYGNYDAHDGLWKMAELSAKDVLDRMAVVPRVLEARGLDVTPAMISKFEDNNGFEIANILRVIYRDEIGHVSIGDKWFKTICEQRQLDASETFKRLLINYELTAFNGPVNRSARIEAGFSAKELDDIEQGSL